MLSPRRRFSHHRFPRYSAAERTADAAVHWLGVPAAVIASGWLLVTAATAGLPGLTASLAIYCLGLIGMLAASAAYNLARPGRVKELLRRLDHAMIFVMIAGSYTPFAVHSLGDELGGWLCLAVWGVAGLGITLKLVLPRRFEALGMMLYLGMGWMVLATLDAVVAALPGSVLLLLLLGGLLYTLGAGVHAFKRLPFHNAAWHALVLLAAGLHFAAISLAFVA